MSEVLNRRTSFFELFPDKNSFQAINKFSTEIILSKPWTKTLPLAPPPLAELPIIHDIINFYKDWQKTLTHFPNASRHSLGFRIDTLAVDIFESLFSVTFLAKDKLSAIQGISTKLDSLKFLLRLAWEIKALDNNKYSSLSVQLGTI